MKTFFVYLHIVTALTVGRYEQLPAYLDQIAFKFWLSHRPYMECVDFARTRTAEISEPKERR